MKSKTLIALLTMMTLSAISVLSVPASASQSVKVIWADYSTFGMNDDGDFNHPTIRISTEGIERIYDMGQPAQFCSRDSGFFCIYGHLFNIAVPRHNLKSVEQWRFGHVLFKVIPHHRPYPLPPPPGKPDLGNADRFLNLVGDQIDYYAIESIPDDKKDDCHSIYLYSPNRGLIGIIDHCNGQPVLFRLLEEQFGPGSEQFDANISTDAILSAEVVATLTKQ